MKKLFMAVAFLFIGGVLFASGNADVGNQEDTGSDIELSDTGWTDTGSSGGAGSVAPTNPKKSQTETSSATDQTKQTRNVAPETKNAETYYKQGLAYTEKKDYDAAIKSFTEAIKINPYYAEAFTRRGNVYGGVDEFANAIVDYTNAITLNTKLAEAYFYRGLSYFKLYGIYTNSTSLLDKAADDLISFISIRPDSTEGQMLLGIVRQLQVYGITKKDNSTLEDRLTRLLDYNKSGEVDKAIEECNKILNIDADKSTPPLSVYPEEQQFLVLVALRIVRGNSYYRRFKTGNADYADDIFRAIYDYKQVLTLDPNFEDAKQFLQENERYIK
jgi:tetratricopeptide (TPR) repeat protein